MGFLSSINPFSGGGNPFENLGGIADSVAGKLGIDTEGILEEIGAGADIVSGVANQASSFVSGASNYASLLNNFSSASSPTAALKNALASKALGFDASVLSDAEIFARLGGQSSISGLSDSEAASLQQLLGNGTGLGGYTSGTGAATANTNPVYGDDSSRVEASLKENGWSQEEIDLAKTTPAGRAQMRAANRQIISDMIKIMMTADSDERKSQREVMEHIMRNTV